MSTVNGKLLEFFVRIPKLEVDGSNWVIFKDCFAFAAAAAGLEKHIDGTGSAPNPPVFALGGPTPLTTAQTTEIEQYEEKQSKWMMGEAVVKQAIATTIPDSLFIEVRKEVTARLMWEAVRMKREKKSRMVTVDLRRKLQAEKCSEHDDMRAHLNKLQTMREDLASMGASIVDEDFTSIILGSIPPSYDTYIAAITATSTLLNQALTPTNLIDAICDKADRKAIKNPKPKREEHDAAFVAGQPKRGGGNSGSKKSKKDVECFNCHKKGHLKRDCWAPGGGAEGKGPKNQKGKQKETAAKTEAKDDEDTDAVWMASAEENVRAWLAEFEDGDFEKWDEQESAGESWEDDIFSSETDTNSMPDLISANTSLTSLEDLSSESDISELTFEVNATAEGYWANTGHVSEDLDDDMPDLMSVSDSLDEDEMPDLISVFDSSEDNSDSESDDSADEIGGSFDVPIEMVDEAVDCGMKPETRTYSTAMLAGIASASPNREIELYDSGASRHMSPYRRNFINFIKIKGRTITAADGQEFMATGLGDMHVELPNGKSMSQILLKDVLYAPNMGATLISISKIAGAGFKTVFHGDLLKIFGPKDRMLGCINVRNGLYRV